MKSYRPVSGTPPLSSSRETAFPDSTHVYEPPPWFLSRHNAIPCSLRAWTTVPTVVLMLILAAVIEVTLYLSIKRHGFSVGHFSTEQAQWLTGFLPVLVIGPIVWICYCMDRDLKILQPYVALSQGSVRADQSVLLRVEEMSIFTIVYSAFKYRNGVIVTASIIVFISALWYPLAATLFFVKDGVYAGTTRTTARSLAAVGLNPSYKDLTSFAAAAGYAEAAALYNLSDPPFVSGGWTVAEFTTLPNYTQNSILSVNTTAILTNVSCTVVSGVSVNPSSTTQNFTLTATLPGQGAGCNMRQIIDGSAGQYQYGVSPATSCSFGQGGEVSRRSVIDEDPFAGSIFWFAALPVRRGFGSGGNSVPGLVTRQAQNPIGSAVICSPTIAFYSVEALVSDTTGFVLDVKVIGDASSNNVTQVFDGLFFNKSDLGEPSVQQLAVAVQSGISSSIFRTAMDPSQGTDIGAAFQQGFLEATKKIYTQYLSTLARSVYFVPTNTPIDAKITITSLRLFINSISGHIFATLLFLAALSNTMIHLIHSRQRKYIHLASPPGSMAHYIGLLAGGDNDRLVGPLDDEKTMQLKLSGRWFMLDGSGVVVPVPEHNYAIVGRDLPVGRHAGRHSRSRSELGEEQDDSQKALLTPEYKHQVNKQSGN